MADPADAERGPGAASHSPPPPGDAGRESLPRFAPGLAPGQIAIRRRVHESQVLGDLSRAARTLGALTVRDAAAEATRRGLLGQARPLARPQDVDGSVPPDAAAEPMLLATLLALALAVCAAVAWDGHHPPRRD